MGHSGFDDAVNNNGNVYGSYIHGLFDEAGIADRIVAALYAARGLEYDGGAVQDICAYREEQYDILADTARSALDMELIYRILEDGA